MTGRVLLDTNIVIALFVKDQAVIEKLRLADEVFMSSIALGELYFGARNSARTEENLVRLDTFAESNVVLRCNDITAKYYGQIKHQLKVAGTPIPENDIWISAIATQFGLVLVTRDSHFDAIDNLKLERW